MLNKSPLVLLILDGWGYRKENQYNAISAAQTPHWDEWWETCPHLLLDASGPCVGLPQAQMGNSEVGHMHIGAGRVIAQDFTRINDSISTNKFADNPVFTETIEDMKQKGKAIHVLGMLSNGGVHSHENHLFSFLTACAQRQFSNVYLHLFLDGRDTPPQSALTSFSKLQNYLNQHPVATLSSISGRYYAMDRDKRWQRIEPAYRLLTEKISNYSFGNVEDAIHHFYEQKINDEFFPPTRIGEGRAIEDGDSIFFFNFRADRARQLTQALLLDDFKEFNRPVRPQLSHFVTMTQYAKTLPTRAAFPPLSLQNTLGEVISKHDLSQLRIAETEKYAHVTFFLNGGTELVYPNEDRILIPSPLVATYDLQPEMSAPELTKTLVEAIQSNAYNVIICNYANADMVGHTGDFTATVKAIEYLDQCMGEIWKALRPLDGKLLITADHGNAEAMFDDTTKQPHTAHTHQPVPFLYVGGNWHSSATQGTLVDVAPTVLTLLGITPPKEMTGRPLLVRDHVAN
jgi:2,3-bisphosphoglycerate-independent phosphoglycerate mutase